MTHSPTYTAFVGDLRLVTAPLPALLSAVKAHLDSKGRAGPPLLIFDDLTGQQTDFDFRGTVAEVLARAGGEARRVGPGRPKLGVVSREVSLLPRHWEWLESQRGGASGALRRLIDEARRAQAGQPDPRQRQEAADRFMRVVAGDRPHYEEASRALYAADRERLEALTQAWPDAVRTHLLYLLEPPFADDLKPLLHQPGVAKATESM
ncbi:DUF2239 family protein [Deinococcus sp.]|uniref:DUF2239 family protein n=1 Tax=Deinococcus sp. TaxID=47478 RepID=UPI003CC6398B